MSELVQDYRNIYVPDDQAILDHLAPRSSVHYIPSIHAVVTYLHVFSFMALVTLGVVFTHMGDSNFFKFTDPVVSGHTIENRWELAVLCTIIGIDSFFARISSEVVGEWKSLFVRDEEHRQGGGKAKAIGLVVFDLGMYWVRTAMRAVFLYSQISFALAFAIGDMLAHYIVTNVKVSDYLRKEGTQPAGASADNFYRRHWSEPWMWVLVALQVIGFGLLQLAFWLSGFFKSDYFEIGPPISFFAIGMNHDLSYWIVVGYVFLDQLVASYASANINPWIFSYVYNNSRYKTDYDQSTVYMIFYINKVVSWLRSIVVLNLMMEQVTFTAVFFLAELIYSVAHTWMVYDSGGRSPDGVILATILRVIQGLSVIAFALSMQVWKPLKIVDAEGHKTEFGYFVPPPPFFMLGEMFDSGRIFWLFALYAFFDRAVTTMAAEIISPYIAYVINGGDHHGMYYGRSMTKVIVWMDNIARWVRTVFSTHFMLSSFYFSLVMMVADVATSAVVLDAYMQYKKRATHAVDLYHHMFGFDTDPDVVLDEYDDAKVRSYQKQIHYSRGAGRYAQDDDKRKVS